MLHQSSTVIIGAGSCWLFLLPAGLGWAGVQLLDCCCQQHSACKSTRPRQTLFTGVHGWLSKVNPLTAAIPRMPAPRRYGTLPPQLLLSCFWKQLVGRATKLRGGCGETWIDTARSVKPPGYNTCLRRERGGCLSTSGAVP
jgi:hypothetical protein